MMLNHSNVKLYRLIVRWVESPMAQVGKHQAIQKAECIVRAVIKRQHQSDVQSSNSKKTVDSYKKLAAFLIFSVSLLSVNAYALIDDVPVLQSEKFDLGLSQDDESVSHARVDAGVKGNVDTRVEIKEDVTRYGVYEIFDQSALAILDVNKPIEQLATGFEWAEGPVWVKQGEYLLFSDIPANKVFKYDPKHGLSIYLSNSGYSNGLVLGANSSFRSNSDPINSTAVNSTAVKSKLDRLVLLQSRSRQIAVMNTQLNDPQSDYRILVSQYEGKRLNSPNDGVLTSFGDIFFTDPPYGLPQQLDDPNKELAFQGVYQLTVGNELRLIDDAIKLPNGIALSPDENTLYVAASDPDRPAWYQYSLNVEKPVNHKRVLYEVADLDPEHKGLPDGLKVHPSGVIFATGPQGIWLFNPQGKLLAKIHLDSIAANLAFNTDFSTVYVTAHHQLLAFDIQ
ncbi:SMP-30/gluconolactonase/LRE family protein [Shewanella sp. 1_MG-2023]|uniref:SMP-30/gluconolactonase/LRE family protein n=1 Tax=unclassified Shewanella TaxID=196818 RepID=UPI0026E219EA|nr:MULTISPECIES: SMP-30/gluconolactonase/LRE family protein [unclassified Shewanella]MDO6613433.1 SMP-30/gluconolactonase/LRE family protein [Shewanella sp. 7_MG-2023]MDO6770099.1 SMP-30/gluconolactonase/LRE family protein [Shewanella sp. 2_MG-2023]MDO6794789.1 SMP-30/gluconolactonase/LRE family protein [Shewanella sp. 1_MG-2023]